MISLNATTPGSLLRRVVRALPPLLGALLLAAGCKQEAPPPPPPPAVVVMTVTTTNVPITTEIIGQLDSPQNVEVRARVEAFVQEIPFAEGTEVKEGALLFALDKKPFEEKLWPLLRSSTMLQATVTQDRADEIRRVLGVG